MPDTIRQGIRYRSYTLWITRVVALRETDGTICRRPAQMITHHRATRRKIPGTLTSGIGWVAVAKIAGSGRVAARTPPMTRRSHQGVIRSRSFGMS
jgi:hypothetical protein